MSILAKHIFDDIKRGKHEIIQLWTEKLTGNDASRIFVAFNASSETGSPNGKFLDTDGAPVSWRIALVEGDPKEFYITFTKILKVEMVEFYPPPQEEEV